MPLFAKDHYDRAMQKAFMNVSSVLSESEFKELGWQAVLLVQRLSFMN